MARLAVDSTKSSIIGWSKGETFSEIIAAGDIKLLLADYVQIKVDYSIGE
jgi:hypothetical protein